MKKTEIERNQKEHKKVHKIYEGLNLREMEHLLFLLCERVKIPHAFNDGIVKDMEVENVIINGVYLGIITDQFANHCENTANKKN